MKEIKILLVASLFILLPAGCRTGGDNSGSKPTDLITIKTLGLAYLEEFKHEEAEKEFLRFIKLSPEDKFGYANLGLVYLRLGRYPEAKEQLFKAIKIAPDDPDIRLLLATVYRMNSENDKAISELTEALKTSPDHIKMLYDLSELYSTRTDNDSEAKREECIRSLTEKAPGNLVPLLSLTEILIKKGLYDQAVAEMEIILRQFAEFPKEASEYYEKTLANLKKGDKENAVLSFTIFNNYLKVTNPYQAGIMDLKGPGGALIGFPVITFAQQTSGRMAENESLLDILVFSDATASSGLDIVSTANTVAALNDYDGDDDIDIYSGSYDKSTSTYKHFLLNNNMGRYKDVAAEAGIDHRGIDYGASFADFDNDGFPDLLILNSDGNKLYRNNGTGSFGDLTKKTALAESTGESKALFLDADHDGDLDVLITGPSKNLVFRNNSDGTFLESSVAMGLAGDKGPAADAAFGDFDEDGDIDLVTVSEKGGITLFSNQRQGIFKDVTETSGLIDNGGSLSVAVGDYNNDGFLDLFITPAKGGKFELFRNLRNGRFEADKENEEMIRALGSFNASDASFIDFNNDGYLDLTVAGERPENGGKGLFLFYNDGKSKFSDVSRLLPDDIMSLKQINIFDYNNDGDLDILATRSDGGLYLFRNDGGNENHYIRMKLVGLRAGSAKNNHFGIGAKVEMRAGELYETMVVNDPNIHFGIGSRSYADIIRITWTNGVPQNIFQPGSDQKLIEAQTLKGSCPFLYTWNGENFEFSKDIMWRSALGMPLGIMGGTTAYAFADASDDFIKIESGTLKEKDGRIPVQITSELWETIYTDRIELVAVDHPEATEVFVPEQFTPPPFPGLKITSVDRKTLPVSATDSYGNDLLPELSEKDDRYAAGFKPEKYQGVIEMNELILDPGNTGRNGKLLLFLNGWIFPTDASINYALSQSPALDVKAPVIDVRDTKGNWVTVIDKLGFPMGKNKTVIADLSGKFLSDDHTIRIRTNMEIYWDYVFFSDEISSSPNVATALEPVSADLHYRGFSASYRKGGRYGPHWFDYSIVEKGQKWRDLTGNYTRYGDVLPLLTGSDNKYIISNAGDETTVEFETSHLPELKKGWKRDYFIHSVGWVKDGDMNTAYGNTVEPLPWHGMKSYPPAEDDKYPDDPELLKYQREYNTRVVTQTEFINAIKPK